ncbi:MAG: serine hydrolase domain-containing protein [Bacteroidota bacterium]
MNKSLLFLTNFFLIFSLILSKTAFSQDLNRIDGTPISKGSITEKLQFLQQEANVHGLSVMVMDPEEILYEGAFGMSNMNEGIPLSNTQTFYAASLSKPLFAYLVMRLVNEGKLDLDRPIVDYLDKPIGEYTFKHDYEGYQDIQSDERHTKITSRMCLSHSSGFPNWRYIGKSGINFGNPLTIEFEPGTRYSYSGEGIQLLQLAVEQITGQGLEDLAIEYVFEPLGMEMTSFLWQEKFEGNYVLGHHKKKKVLNRRKRDQEFAAGSMETTPQDYARFIQAVLRGENLSKDAFEEMISPQIAITSKQQFGKNATVETDENKGIGLSYGLGWGIYNTPYGKAVFKEGHLQGWEHFTVFYPEQKKGILIMTNSSNGESIFKELLEVVMGDSWMPWYWENYIPYND